MSDQNEVGNVLVYRYGLLAPTGNADLVWQQMRAAHRYRNALTEIERGRRAALRSARSEYVDIAELERAAAEAELALEAALRTVRRQRAVTRSRSDTPAQRAAVKEARERKREATAALRERRRALRDDESLRLRDDAVNVAARDLAKNLYAHSPDLYWGQRAIVDDAMEDVRASPLYDGADPNDPRFARWSGEGRVGLQIMQGISPAELLSGEDTRVQVVPSTPPPGVRHKREYVVLRLRVGSDGRAPIWAEWPMYMDRDLPDGAVVKHVSVSVRRVGPREEWAALFTIAVPAPKPVAPKASVVALTLGWRAFKDEIRVAVWLDSSDHIGELRLGGGIIGSLAKSEEIRSGRDADFERIRSRLVAWLEAQIEAGADLPAWLTDLRRSIPLWRSPARLVSLLHRWTKERITGDEETVDAIEAWRYHDRHLWAWETSARRKAHMRRRDAYRKLAAELAEQHGTLVLSDFDLRIAARKRPTEAEKAEWQGARSNRQTAAVSELRTALKQAFARRGGTVVTMPAAEDTHTCAKCGTVEEWNAAEMVHHTCGGCGVTWDQDDNATEGLLTRWRAERERRSGEGEAGTARVEKLAASETRWARAARLKAEREARAETARKAHGKEVELLET